MNGPPRRRWNLLRPVVIRGTIRGLWLGSLIQLFFTTLTGHYLLAAQWAIGALCWGYVFDSLKE